MYETDQDLHDLQQLLDDSYERAGQHLSSIHTPAVRLTAREVTARLTGMRVLVVATVTAGGRPVTGPVDAFFVHGAWWFSTAATALRARHLRERPWASVTYVEGESLVVVGHGTVTPLDVSDLPPDYRRVIVDTYGAEWVDSWGDDIAAFRFDASRLFAADMSRHAA